MKNFTKFPCIAAMMFLGTQLLSAQAPTVAPPEPKYPSSDVVSFTSTNDSYLGLEDTFVSQWGSGSTFDFVEVQDKGVMVLSLDPTNGWMALETKGKTNDFRDYDYLHMDVFCNDALPYFRIGFHSWAEGENYFPWITDIKAGEWYSIDYPLSIMKDQGFKPVVNLLRFGHDRTKAEFIGAAPEGITSPAEISYPADIYLANIFVYKGTPMGINAEQVNGSLNVFPSVFTETVNIESEDIINSVSVYNVAGQAVNNFKIESQSTELNLSSLNKGFYLLSVKLANGKTITERVVKK